MTYYILKRLFLLICTLAAIFFINSFLISQFPGSPFDYINQSQRDFDQQNFGLSTHNMPLANDDNIGQFNNKNLLKHKKVKGSFHLFKNYIKGNFGESIYKHQKVINLIIEKSFFSFCFTLIYFILMCLFSLFLSILKSIYYHSKIYKWLNTVLITLNHIPTYVLAISLIFLFAEGGLFPIFKIRHLTSEIQNNSILFSYNYYILPLLILLISGVSRISLMFTQNINNESNKSYVLQAYLKGLSRKEVIIQHVIKNKLITFIPYLLKHFIDTLFSSTFMIEIIFSLDGLASLSFEAAITRDYPLIIGCLFFYSFVALLFNFFSDLLIMKNDIRIKM